MAAERLSCLARNGRSPGEESLTGAVAAQAIEAQPSFGQIKPSEATWFARSDSTRRRRGGYRMTRTRGQARQAKEKKHLRTDGRHCMSGPRPHNAPHGGSCRICWRRHPGPIEPLQRPRSGHALGIRDRSSRPVEIANRGSSALPGRRRQRIRRCHAGGNALSGTGRGRKRHARPGRGRHDDRARHCHGVSPTLGGYADVREAECGMISCDGSR